MKPLVKMALGCLLLAALPVGASAEPSCSPLVKEQNAQGASVYQVDKVWSGTRVGFSGLMKGQVTYVAYYDPQRWLTVAQLDFQKKTLCRQRLDSQFGGWDSHNGATLSMSKDGTIHVAANMHNTVLTLADTDPSGSIASLKLDRPATPEETIVTYPTFVRGQNGDLLFMYRSGRSGNGKWFINRWSAGHWDRMGEIFSGRSRSGEVSAYPSQFVQDSTGVWHFAIVWRTRPDASANVAVSYASTRDFREFHGADGRRLNSPLTPESADTVEAPGENAGLMNNASVFLDDKNKPIVVYTRYGSGGKNAIVIAKPQQSGWMIKDIADSKGRTEIAGGGTLNAYPQFRINSDGANAAFYIAFPNEPASQVRINLDNLTPTNTAPAKLAAAAEAPPSLPKLPLLTPSNSAGMVQPAVITSPVKDATQPNIVRGSLQWIAQPSNHDQARQCGSDGKTGCNPPPAPLMLVIDEAKN